MAARRRFNPDPVVGLNEVEEMAAVAAVRMRRGGEFGSETPSCTISTQHGSREHCLDTPVASTIHRFAGGRQTPAISCKATRFTGYDCGLETLSRGNG
jgi:hypothetical protein